MIRDSIKKHLIGMNPDFRYRGEEPGRLENFSDAVFALAITLLLISTSPPTNFEQIKRFAWDLIPFILCMVFIIMVWFEHFTFYFRYGLRNGRMVVLNSIFLVIVLFYVYPLKFLTKLALWPFAIIFNRQNLITELSSMISGEDMADLMIIYGIGAFSVSFILMLMYRHAYKKADELQLNEIERFDTQTKIDTNLLMAAVPLVSVAIAILFHWTWMGGMLAGFTYMTYTPIMFIHGSRSERKRKALLASLQGTKSVEPNSNKAD
jgi:uncharacterized membrane protein